MEAPTHVLLDTKTETAFNTALQSTPFRHLYTRTHVTAHILHQLYRDFQQSLSHDNVIWMMTPIRFTTLEPDP